MTARYQLGKVPGTFANGTTDVIYLNLVIGQSWAEGANRNANDAPVTPTPLDGEWSLMLNVGASPGSDVGTSFVPLHEQRKVMSVETICSRASNAICRQLTAAGLEPRPMLWISSAFSGRALVKLKRGTGFYEQTLDHVVEAIAIAQGAGQKIVLENLVILHGEADSGLGTSRFEYYRTCMTWIDDYIDDIVSMTGQTKRPYVFLTQTCRGSRMPMSKIQLAQMDLMLGRPGQITLVGPQYQYPVDNLPTPPTNSPIGGHLSALGYGLLGEMIGHAMAAQRHGSGHLPVMSAEPHKATWASTEANPVIEIKMNQPIVIDTSGKIISLDDIPNFGFDFTDGSEHPPSIRRVTTTSRKAPGITMRLVANTVTIDGMVSSPETLSITCNDHVFEYHVQQNDTLHQITRELAKLIGKYTRAVVENCTIKIPGALQLNCETVTYGEVISIELNGKPTGPNPQLWYATRTTGLGWSGNIYGARGAVRSVYPFGESTITGEPMYHWMCVDCFDLPNIR
jgi:hypothetical protein